MFKDLHSILPIIVYDIGEDGLEQNGIIIHCHHIKDIDLCFSSLIAFNIGLSGKCEQNVNFELPLWTCMNPLYRGEVHEL